jgi:hypothetical protein
MAGQRESQMRWWKTTNTAATRLHSSVSRQAVPRPWRNYLERAIELKRMLTALLSEADR